ncbi:MAG: class I SAM-dependent methyltransferase [Fermentimonas sp.]|nr:class I SAM-dependent methyltransferase [Fermentimonas sp.]
MKLYKAKIELTLRENSAKLKFKDEYFMPQININKCPICGSSETAKVFDAVDHFSTKEIFPICDCLSCGFRFTNKFPSEDEIGRYYDSPDYISHSDSKKGLINQLYHFFRKRMLKKKVNLVSKSVSESQSIRLLDIGCGTGYFLNSAKEIGHKVSGIEKDNKAREFAVFNFGLDVKSEEELWEIENESFEVITLWHVLEHMQSLNEVVSKIYNILSPDGILILALPNHHSYDAKKYKEFWAAYDVPRHLWHFTPYTVEKLLSKHKFKIVKQKTMPLDAFYISMLSEKYKGISKLTQYFNAILFGKIGYLHSLSNITQSSSVIYIAKKSQK